MKIAASFVLYFIYAHLAFSQQVARSFAAEVGGVVQALFVQPDGRILVGGHLSLRGASGLVRFHPDGTLDTRFAADDMAVNSIARQADGKILAAGQRVVVNKGSVARCSSDGSLDPTFEVTADHEVRAMAVQRDQKIIIGGYFTNVGGLDRAHIARLNDDGTVDESFEGPAISGTHASVHAVAVQSDGKILFGGFYRNVAGLPIDGLVRVDASGRFDPTFKRTISGMVTSIIIQPDGKILAAGSLLGIDERADRVARLNPDGSMDKEFTAKADPNVQAMALQPDGRIVVGGWFNELSGHKRKYFGRLNADGSCDTTFNASADSLINALAIQLDGKIVAGGQITNLSGQPCKYLGRVNADGSPDVATQ